MMDDIIDNKSGAAIPVLNIIYEYLTDRKVATKKPVIAPSVDIKPSYTRPTATQKIKDAGRANYEYSKNFSGMTTSGGGDPLVIGDTGRRLPLKSKSKNNGSRSNLQSQNSSILFKDVQIKTLDKYSTRNRLRSSGKPPQSAGTNMSGVESIHSSFRGEPMTVPAPEMTSTGVYADSIIEKLNQCVEQELEGTEAMMNQLDPRKDMIVSFIESCELLDAEDTQRVFKALKDFCMMKGSDYFLRSPKSFWKFVNIMTKGLLLPDASTNFLEFVDLFHAVGNSLVEKDQNTAWGLFNDFAMPKMVPLLKKDRFKRRHVLAIMYAFCSKDPQVHMDVIKSLQDALPGNNDAPYLSCLSHLIVMEESFNEKLLDLYIYYCIMGLSNSSPAVRASSLNMVSTIALEKYETVMNMVDRLLTMAQEETWWEIRIQVVCISATMLISNQLDDTQASIFYEIIETVLGGPCTMHMYTIALSYLAPALKNHPSLLDRYCIMLLSLSEDERLALLEQEPDHVETLQVGSSAIYDIVSIPFVWDSLGLVSALANHVEDAQIENFEMKHFDLLEAALNTTKPSSDSLERWLSIFESLKFHMFVGLYDDENCEYASDVILQFLRVLGNDGVGVAIGALSKMVMKAFKGVDDDQIALSKRCQEVLASLLIGIYDLGGGYTPKMAALARQLKDEGKQQTAL
eukprot:CAMPEP_0117424654 /NCGR_PEP_ID=MMETSP0758-20121206/5033_1 /TAXON_ID=63605 /ORGANISM="Percolomonas cosmopolitus, Strain AE-1 (ATCC 50343)" /LENGTH=684 /DNA_ID=CAMNT_0005208569 /DNA_START=167 /DNA_END=2218 /DNA_ORIENTATION=-